MEGRERERIRKMGESESALQFFYPVSKNTCDPGNALNPHVTKVITWLLDTNFELFFFKQWSNILLTFARIIQTKELVLEMNFIFVKVNVLWRNRR